MRHGDDIATSGLSRRELFARAAAAGVALSSAELLAAEQAVAATPKRGGALRVALLGGSPSGDTLDPNGSQGAPELAQAFRENVYSKLTDLSPAGSYEPQLAESMEPNKGADKWLVKLKAGVEFHDGSTLTADDVIYSLQRILDPASKLSSAAGNIDMIDPKRLRRVNKTTFEIGLNRPYSDLLSAVGQRYVSIVKRGAKGPFTVANTIGSGPFKLTGWQAGQKHSYVANRNYFETGTPYLDSMTIIGIPDPVARVNALVSGQVDCICDVPVAQIPVLRGRGLKVLIGKGGSWVPIYMNTQMAPFTDVRVRQAMKLLIDREQAMRAGVGQYGSLGNDLFARWDPLYDKSLPQRTFDPEKARSLLQAAGQLGTNFVLHTSEAASDMIPIALVFAQGAKKAGVNVTVQKDPADSYWDNVYGKVSFAFSSWGYRPFFAQWYQSYKSWNAYETAWSDASQAKAYRLVYKASASADPKRRKELADEAQKLEWQAGGYIIPYFKAPIDGYNKRVNGLESSVFPFLGWYRFWHTWLA